MAAAKRKRKTKVKCRFLRECRTQLEVVGAVNCKNPKQVDCPLYEE